MATVQPSPSPPMRWSAGTRTPEKNTSANPVRPCTWRTGRTSTPGLRRSIARQVSPRCRSPADPVRTSPKIQSANRPYVVQVFCPSTTYSSPDRVARVRTPARSLPASGSEKPCDHTSSARSIRGSQRRC